MDHGSSSSEAGLLPYQGPASPLYATAYAKPGRIYLFSFFVWFFLTVLRYGLVFKTLDVLVIWGTLDNLLLAEMMVVLAYHIFMSHHRWRYLNARPLGDVQPSDITHCLALLVANEPEEQLTRLVADLKALPCQGRKVLIVGMELKATKEPVRKIAAIRDFNGQPGGKPFDEVLYTLHELREHEIVGTGSNHYEVQMAAERHFDDKSNVILTKFDVNMKLDNDKKLLQEMEAVWCSVDRATRYGITFMPNIVWSADVPDLQRVTLEKICSYGMSVSTCVAPFSMAFVSGSLEAICAGGYTPPSLLSEDELAFTKKQCLVPHPRTYRLCSVILKVFVTSNVGNSKFAWDFLDKKLKRWFLGWLEVQFYLLTWIFFRGYLFNVGAPHPRVRNKCRALGTWLLCFLRMYTAFVTPVSILPMAFIWHAAHWKSYVYMLETGGESYYGWLLNLSFYTFGLVLGLNIVVAIRVQSRLYMSFDCLKFHWSTIIIDMLGSALFMLPPIFLLWTYLKHGFWNMPAGHVVVVAAHRVSHAIRKSVASLRRQSRPGTEARAGVLLEMGSAQ